MYSKVSYIAVLTLSIMMIYHHLKFTIQLVLEQLQ